MARYHSDNPSVFILATPPLFLPFSHLFCYCLNLLACLHFLLTKQSVFNKGSAIVHCTIMCMRICINIIRNEPTAYRIGLNQYRDDRQPLHFSFISRGRSPLPQIYQGFLVHCKSTFETFATIAKLV